MKRFLAALIGAALASFCSIASAQMAGALGGTVVNGDAVSTPPPFAGMPNGIPDPGFCLSETTPEPPPEWFQGSPTTVSGYYYVDRDESGNTDTGRPLGRPGAARATIPAAITGPAVVFLNGHYSRDQANSRRLTMTGTADNPVWIIGYDAGDPPYIDRPWEVFDTSWLYLDTIEIGADLVDPESTTGRLDLFGQISGGASGAVDHVCIRNSEISGNLSDGGLGLGLGLVEQVVIYDNYIHNNGDVNADFDQDRHGITVGGSGNKNNIWVLNNELSYNSGDGIQINGVGSGGTCLNGTAGTSGVTSCSTNHIYVGANDMHHNKQSGFWTKQAQDVIFSENESYNHRFSDSSPGAGGGYQYAPDFVWFICNRTHDNDEGIVGQSGSSLGFVDGQYFWLMNTIYDTHRTSSTSAYGAIRWRESQGAIVTADNNTLYNVDRGIHSDATTGYVSASNNVLNAVNTGSGPANRVISVSDATVASNSEFHSNVFVSTWDALLGATTYTTTGAFNNGTTRTNNTAVADSGVFVNTAGKDFHLAPGSPAIDVGAAIDAYSIFASRYGFELERDCDGDVIPQGSAPDAGADEAAQ